MAGGKQPVPDGQRRAEVALGRRIVARGLKERAEIVVARRHEEVLRPERGREDLERALEEALRLREVALRLP